MSQWDDPTRGYDDRREGWAAPGGRPADGAHEHDPGTTRPGERPGEHDRGHAGGPSDWRQPSGDAVAPAGGRPSGAFVRVGPGGVPELWPGPIPLRPLSFGEVLESAFRVLRFNPRTIFGLSFVVLAVTTVVGLALVFGLSSVLLDGQDLLTTSPTGGVPGELGLQLNSMLLSFVTFFLSGILIVPIAEAALGRRLTAGESWRRIKGRLLPLLGYLLISALILVALVVPAVAAIVAAVLSESGVTIAFTVIGVLIALLALYAWITVSLCLAPAAIVLEQVGPITAIKRSFRLIRGAFWRTFGLLVVVTLITSIIAGMLMGGVMIAVALLLFAGEGNPAAAFAYIAVTSVMTALVSTIVQPLSSAVNALIYLDRRFRTEALAVDLLAEAERTNPL